jgi:hypothetical protein
MSESLSETVNDVLILQEEPLERVIPTPILFKKDLDD